MRSQCEAETLVESGGMKLQTAAAGFAAVTAWAQNIKTPPAQILAGVAAVFGTGFQIWSVANEAKRSRLEEGCKLEIKQAAQQPNGDGGTGGGTGSNETGDSAGVAPGNGCKWQFTSANSGDTIPANSGKFRNSGDTIPETP